MSKLFNDARIYLKNSDKVRLADYRARIVRETGPRRPDEHEDLVFVSDKKEKFIPEKVLMSWRLFPIQETFFTTAERCKQMISPDQSYWTQEKLEFFKNAEMQIWRDWWDDHVYGIIIEKWDEKQREWKSIDSLWGMYGAKDVYDNLNNEIDLLYDEVGGASIPICIDEEEMKYEFDNVEHKPNEFN